MSAAKPCELWVGTSTRFFKLGEFKSLSACRRYISDSDITCYHEIIPKKK